MQLLVLALVQLTRAIVINGQELCESNVQIQANTNTSYTRLAKHGNICAFHFTLDFNGFTDEEILVSNILFITKTLNFKASQ